MCFQGCCKRQMTLHWQQMPFNIPLKGKVKVNFLCHVKDASIIIYAFQLEKEQEQKAVLSVSVWCDEMCVPCVHLQYQKIEALNISKKKKAGLDTCEGKGVHAYTHKIKRHLRKAPLGPTSSKLSVLSPISRFPPSSQRSSGFKTHFHLSCKLYVFTYLF